MKIALVHDWLTGMRGGEKVLEILCELYPKADIFTLIHIPENISPVINRHRIETSFIQNLPGARKSYRNYLPLFPMAIEKFDLTGYDLVISSSHCVAKGVITGPGACHISYIHAPMRYAWELFYQYFSPLSTGKLKHFLISCFISRLRVWDRVSADRVDYFIANSSHTKRRITKHYRRSSSVVCPPVDTDFFTPGEAKKEDFYLVVSALVPYKRLDIAVEACKLLKKRLIIVGRGPERKRLQAISDWNIELVGWLPDKEVRELYRKAKGFLFPGEEDFGITSLEAQACGLPVIAYEAGGAKETVVPGQTGLFFKEQTVQSLATAIGEFEKREFLQPVIRNHAEGFGKQQFVDRIKREIDGYTTLFYKLNGMYYAQKA